MLYLGLREHNLGAEWLDRILNLLEDWAGFDTVQVSQVGSIYYKQQAGPCAPSFLLNASNPNHHHLILPELPNVTIIDT